MISLRSHNASGKPSSAIYIHTNDGKWTVVKTLQRHAASESHFNSVGKYVKYPVHSVHRLTDPGFDTADRGAQATR